MRQFLWLVCGVVAICNSGCKEKELSAEQKRASALSSAGFAASLAASSHVDAARACEIAGIADMSTCSANNGTLLAEREAKVLAAMAIRRTNSYFKKCESSFPFDYCKDLIQRAIEIEYRKPIVAGDRDDHTVPVSNRDE